MAQLLYPSAEEIIELNVLVLSVIRVKKGDRHQLLGPGKLRQVVAECMESEGGIYKKSGILLCGLVRAHAFASGNRRTAFVAAKKFLEMNGNKIGVADSPENARVLQGVRDGYYSEEEIVEWVEHGKIRPYLR